MNWLRGVVQKIGTRHAEQRIGIIGNCITGPIPLALLDHPQVRAAVAAQPALPLRFWWHTEADHKSLGISPVDVAHAERSTAKILGLRFHTDCISHPDKINALRERFPGRFQFDRELDYRMDGKPIKVHSTLIGSWSGHGETGQSSRDARKSSRFSLEGLSEIRPAR